MVFDVQPMQAEHQETHEVRRSSFLLLRVSHERQKTIMSTIIHNSDAVIKLSSATLQTILANE
jgi:hypothetical protein